MDNIPIYIARDYEPPKLYDLNYDYTQGGSVMVVQEPHKSDSVVESVWDNIADSVDSGVDVVFDKAKGAWTSTKNAVGNIGSSIVSGVQETTNTLFDTLKKYILVVFIGALILIYVIGRSGVIGQAASFR